MGDLRSLLSVVEAVQARPTFDPSDEHPQLVALGTVRVFALSCYAPHIIPDEEVSRRISSALESDERLVPHVLKHIVTGDEDREGFWLVDGTGAPNPAGDAPGRNATLIHRSQDQELGHCCDVTTGRWVADPARDGEQDGLEADVEVDRVFRWSAAHPSRRTVGLWLRSRCASADRRNVLIAALLAGLVAALGFHAF